MTSLTSRFTRFPRFLGVAAGTLVLLASPQAFAATVLVAPAPVYVRPPQVVVATAPLPTVVVKATPLPRTVYVAHPARAAAMVPGHWAGGVWVPAHVV